MSALKAALEEFVDGRGGGDRVFFTPIPDVVVMRTSQTVLPEDSQHMLYTPALCVVAQGAKQIRVGDDVFDYQEGNALVVSVELPGFGCVTRATAAKPYLGLTIGFDIALMRDVLEQLKTPPRPSADRLGVFIQELNAPMQDCVVRLARLLATPDAIPVLYPGIVRELYFWLLTGPHGGEISKIVRTDSHTRRIADAIHMVRRDFTRPIRVEEMAETARMSASSFHQHFKTITAMSPLQYLKQVRLLEARRLMVTQAIGVTTAAFQVGYESASQFSREYARMFGRPPKQDAEALKARVVPA